MKKLLVYLAVGATTLSLAACGGASQTGSASSGPTTFPATGSPSASGAFVSRSFIPKVSFDEAGWVSVAEGNKEIDLDGGNGATVTIFDAFEVFQPRTGKPVPAPADIGAWLKAHPDLRAEAPVSTTVGGVAATLTGFLVTSGAEVHSALSCALPDCVRLFGLNAHSCCGRQAFLPVSKGQQGRLYDLTVHGQRVFILAIAPSDQFAAFASRVETHLAGVHFGA